MFTKPKEQANLRKIVVQAFVDAWDTTCTKTICAPAAREIGLHPIDLAVRMKNVA